MPALPRAPRTMAPRARARTTSTATLRLRVRARAAPRRARRSRRASAAPVVGEQRERHRVRRRRAAPRRARRDARACSAPRRARRSSHGGKHLRRRPRWSKPTSAGRGAEVAPQAQRRQRHARRCRRARAAQEQSDLGVAEAIDRLHRVADHEQRAAVARLPAGGERLEQLELRERGVLELIDQDVPQVEARRAAPRSVGSPALGERRRAPRR